MMLYEYLGQALIAAMVKETPNFKIRPLVGPPLWMYGLRLDAHGQKMRTTTNVGVERVKM